ncbi:MAG TPA: phage baseplate assembly protein V [Blastocatellia bacterium]|nr:phage baseplate assembly protein V [Blastocatellia bacterium]
MNLFDLLLDDEKQSQANRINGVVVGVVTNNQDPEGMGRVKVRFPWLSDTDESHWARIAAPMAGNQRGVYFLPEVEDEVLVAFEQGDARFPYVLGALWNGKDAPPAINDGKNNIRVIKSRSGHVIRLSDEDGKEKIEVIDKSEKNSVVIETANNTITITASQDIILSATNGTIKLVAQNIEVESSAATKIKAGTDVDVEGALNTNIKGALVNIN